MMSDDYYWEASPHLGMMGSAHSVTTDEPEEDVVDLLHAIVLEVTGVRVERPARRIGFY